jgi:hypothetical protein
MATFSKAFCKHLEDLRSAQLTPAMLLEKFEKYVSNNANKQSGNVYNFPITREINDARNRDECIKCLVDNLESFDFTEGNQAYSLAPQTFVFTKEEYLSQRESRTVVCKASDKGCDCLRIRM